MVGITEVGGRSVFLSPETLRLGTKCLGSSWDRGRGRAGFYLFSGSCGRNDGRR